VTTGLLVKICGITSEQDALLAVGLGADAIGFILSPSPRQVSTALVTDIVKRLPHGVLTVGVFRDEAPARVVEIANRAGLGAVQLHGHETAEECRWVRARTSCTIKAFTAGDRTILRFADFGADYLLIDGPSPGAGAVFDWRLGEGVADPGHLIVSGGLHAGNVAQAIAHLHPFGVDVASGVESSPGRKDPHRLRDFITNARRAGLELEQAGEHAGGAAMLDGGQGAGGDTTADGPYDWSEG